MAQREIEAKIGTYLESICCIDARRLMEYPLIQVFYRLRTQAITRLGRSVGHTGLRFEIL